MNSFALKILRKPLALVFVFILVLLSLLVNVLLLSRPAKVVERVAIQNFCNVSQVRSKQFRFTKPLLYSETQADGSFSDLRQNIQNFIQERISTGKINSAAVYFRDPTTAKWFSINGEEKYNPASIMKLMTLLCYMAESDVDPNVLNQKILFPGHFDKAPVQSIISKELTPGKLYTIKDLLFYMSVNSNNDATVLLNQRLNFSHYNSILSDLELPIPDLHQVDYPINVIECSRFLRCLYNSSLLSPHSSEYALSLLVQSSFKEGMGKYIDPSIKIASKFGERNNGNDKELHETGIFYVDAHPYILTVMTKGKDSTLLPEILADISKMVYDYQATNPGSTSNVSSVSSR